MRNLNVIISISLLAILAWIGFETKLISREEFITQDLLETTLPIDGTIDIEYLGSLEYPANVQ